MTITQSLRDDNAASGSITDAIDKLALAMGGGFRSVSTRQNTDATGRVVQQTVFNSDGTAVSVKRSERNTGGGTKEGTGGTSIVYDGLYWTVNAGYGAHSLEFVFEADDDEKIVIRITANGTEAAAGDDIRILNASLGGEVSLSIQDLSDPYTFIGYPGQSYKVIFETGGGVGSSNGTMIVDYMPELAQALQGNPFSGAWGASTIPEYFQTYVPKLLPSAVISRAGGPALFTTTFSFSFPSGMRPWFPYTSDFVYRVAMVIKYVGIDLGASLGISGLSVNMLGYTGLPGIGEGIDLTGQWAGVVPGGLWPSMVVYFEVDTDFENQSPCIVNVVVTHGAGAYFPSVPTLGYFIVEGRL